VKHSRCAPLYRSLVSGHGHESNYAEMRCGVKTNYLHILVLSLSFLLTCTSHAQGVGDSSGTSPTLNSSAKLVFTYIPPWVSTAWIQGQVLNVNPANYEVTLVFLVEGLGWYSKSYCSNEWLHEHH
jgi:hypothetical protein